MLNISNMFHKLFIYDRRMNQLHKHLSSIIKSNNCTDILDIGAGDGKIDRMLIDSCNVNITGIDVLVRETTYIPIKEYNGAHINLSDNEINTTMMIDMLHHTDDPKSVFKEAVRVSNKYIIIKDHIVSGWWSRLKLKMMDYVGNKHYSVRLPYNYLTKKQWSNMFKEEHLKIIHTKTNLNLYKGLFHFLFDSNLHFIVILEKDVN